MCRWCALAAGGHCDTYGGAEYRRVYAEWIAAGRPQTITEFILEAANRPYPSSSWPETGTILPPSEGSMSSEA